MFGTFLLSSTVPKSCAEREESPSLQGSYPCSHKGSGERLLMHAQMNVDVLKGAHGVSRRDIILMIQHIGAIAGGPDALN